MWVSRTMFFARYCLAPQHTRRQAEYLKVQAELGKSGQTMIVVTHSMAFARNVASTVHVLAGGHDVECGPTAQLFADPQHSIPRSLLASNTLMR